MKNLRSEKVVARFILVFFLLIWGVPAFAGTLIVSEDGNGGGRVDVYNTSGGSLTLTTSYVMPTSFTPHGFTVVGSNLFVANATNNSVEVFKAGKHIASLSTTPDNNPGLSPNGIVSVNGNVYVPTFPGTFDEFDGTGGANGTTFAPISFAGFLPGVRDGLLFDPLQNGLIMTTNSEVYKMDPTTGSVSVLVPSSYFSGAGQDNLRQDVAHDVNGSTILDVADGAWYYTQGSQSVLHEFVIGSDGVIASSTDLYTGGAGMNGLTIDENNKLFWSNYFDGTISSRTPGGVITTEITGLNNPAAMLYLAGSFQSTQSQMIMSALASEAVAQTPEPSGFFLVLGCAVLMISRRKIQRS